MIRYVNRRSCPSERPALTRRQVLALAARMALIGSGTAVVTSCGLPWGDIRFDDDEPVPAPGPGADELARRRVVTDAQGLLALAVAVAGARADLAPLASIVADHHRAHLESLGSSAAETSTGTGTATSTRTSTGIGTGTPTATSTAPLDPVPRWAEQEAEAAGRCLADLEGSTSGLARLLSSIAAARVVHARLAASTAGLPEPALPGPSLPEPTLPEPTLPGLSPQGTGPPEPDATGSTASSSSPTTGAVTPSASAATTSATPSALPVDETARAALTRAIDGEHAAIYAYGVIGARIGETSRPRASEAIQMHEGTRDEVATLLSRSSSTVPAAAPAYVLPNPIGDSQDAVVAAVQLEERLTIAYTDLVASSSEPLRSIAARLVIRTALQAASWRGSGVAFPGLPERSDPAP